MSYTIAVADAHLDGLNKELEQFLAFLSSLQESHTQNLYILGDLFKVWFGTSKMTLPYQIPVVEALQGLCDKGIRISYVEGNRDYFLSPLYLETPFVKIASEYAQEVIGKKQIYFSHGDLVNVHDRQYRLWRGFSRNRLIYAGFIRLPSSVAIRFAHYLEWKFRGTNQKNKSSFPVKTCEAYTRTLWQAGYDIIILGHFHEKRHQEFSINGRQKSLYILPAWKDCHTYLQISDQGECSFRRFRESDGHHL